MSAKTDSFKILGRELQVQRTVGSGGFGDVLLVTRLRVDANPRHGFTFPTQCVVKVMRAGLYEQAELEAAQREVRVLKTLRHPHVVTYLGSWIEQSRGPYQGRFCIALQYCEGGDVAMLIRRCAERRQLLPTDVVVRLMAQVFSALNYSHSLHLIHRDVKPGNVFLVTRGGGAVGDGAVGDAVVGDFGLVRSLEVTGDMAATRVGTPSYVPPEIILGDPYTAKADVFSAGTMFYELLTNRAPFWRRELSQHDNFMRVLHHDPMPRMQASVRGYCSPALIDLVAACLAKREADRPSSYDILVSIVSPLSAHVRNASIPVYVPTQQRPPSLTPPPAARASPPSAAAAPLEQEEAPLAGTVDAGAPARPPTTRELLRAMFTQDPPNSVKGRLTSLLSDHERLLVQLRVLLAYCGGGREHLARDVRNLLRLNGYTTSSKMAIELVTYVEGHYAQLLEEE
ncbi:protein kinase [Lotmaria passim]